MSQRFGSVAKDLEVGLRVGLGSGGGEVGMGSGTGPQWVRHEGRPPAPPANADEDTETFAGPGPCGPGAVADTGLDKAGGTCRHTAATRRPADTSTPHPPLVPGPARSSTPDRPVPSAAQDQESYD